MPKTTKTIRQPRRQKLEQLTCTVCGELKKHTNFYQSLNPIHRETKKLPYCKECLKNMCLDKQNHLIDDKVKEMLKCVDKPFIYDLYKSCLSDTKDTIGNYFRMMNSLHQYNKLGWKDSIFEPISDEEIEDEDKTLIYSKDWSGNYTKRQLDYLEEYLISLKKDFKIVTRNHNDYARKIAKASLAMDEAYEAMLRGGSDARYKQMRESFDSLSKSAQFAEMSRGANAVSLGAFGLIFDVVEKHNWIPKHEPAEPDVYDKLIEQFANINKSL